MISSWEELSESIKDCKKCGLCEGRTNIVIGVGEHNTDIMLIGEGPGADEDAQGIPFVGKAGQLMNQAFAGLGIDRNKLYIANVVKCRPPQNRVPTKEEANSCKEYLDAQINLIKPKMIIQDIGPFKILNTLSSICVMCPRAAFSIENIASDMYRMSQEAR